MCLSTKYMSLKKQIFSLHIDKVLWGVRVFVADQSGFGI